MKHFALGLALLILIPGTAHAYMGPGLGAGAIGAILGVIGSIFLALFAVLYYPIKRALKKRGKGAEPATAKPRETSTAD